MEVLDKNTSNTDLKDYDSESRIFTDDLLNEAIEDTEKLSQTEIGLLNLRFAQGLPGAEDLNIRKMLNLLDRIANDVREFTLKYRHHFQMDPEKHQGTWGKFRMLCLATVIQREWKITYRPDLMDGDFDARDSRSQFIHRPSYRFWWNVYQHARSLYRYWASFGLSTFTRACRSAFVCPLGRRR